MEKTKHTPGPWRIQDRRSHLVIWGKSRSFGYSQSDITPKVVEIPCDTLKIAAEMEANARLIAAAPELLEALKAARGYLHEARMIELNEGDNLENSEWVSTILEIVTAAIAKAEGEEG